MTTTTMMTSATTMTGSMTMTEAPERIWIEDEFGEGDDDQWTYGTWDVRNYMGYDVEYVRADIVQALTAERDRLREAKDQAYLERNHLVALLAGMFPSGLKRTDIPGWDAEWHGAVYIDFPWGQASWHYHDSQAHLFAHLPPYPGEWDGHTTDQKYAAILAALKGESHE